jgi:two-component system nitrogen regulation sensor histidine kinase NtrY
MKLRTKLILFTALVICASVGALVWNLNRFVTQEFERSQNRQAETLVTQFQREFAQRADEVAYALQGIAEAEGTLRMAIDLSRPQSDPSLYARDAQGIATARQLDFLEFAGDDGTVISSAQWPGRIGFKDDWVTQQADWNQEKAFLAKVELPNTVDLGLMAVRVVNVGTKKLYVIGGRRLDGDFLKALVIPTGMRVLLYRNLEAAFVAEALADAEGQAQQPERFASAIESMQKQPHSSEFDIRSPGIAGGQKFIGLPLTGRSGELLAAVFVGTEDGAIARTSLYIRNAGLAIGAAGVFLALIFSWSVSRQVSIPLERLASAARELGAGRWNAKVEARGRGEAAKTIQAFNEMTSQLSARRERLVQAERVAAWRELARNFAVELKVPLFSLQLTLERLARSREETPEQFNETFHESMQSASAEMEALKGIIGRFSEFARMREPRKQAVDVNEILRSAMKSFEPQFQSRGRPPVKPELLLDDYAGKVSADAELLYKGFENVIASSLAAMPMGGTLTVRTTQQKGVLRVDISDTGSGLETGEPIIPGVPQVSKLEGAGLGLATIQTVVSDHGGRMSVQKTGTGTTFHIELPSGTVSTAAANAVTAAPAKVENNSEPKPSAKAAGEEQKEKGSASKPPLARIINY